MRCFAIICFLFVLATGCSHSKDQGQGPLDARESISLKGSLIENMNENFLGKWLERCDYAYRDKEEEILKALDQRASKINEQIQISQGTSDFDRIQFGSLWLRRMKDKSPPPNKWQHQFYSWESLYKSYQRIKELPVNEDWIFLNRIAIFLLNFDRLRIINEENMERGNDSGALILAAESSITECLNKPECPLPLFSQNVEQFLKANTIYKDYVASTSNYGLPTPDSRTYLTKLLKRLQYDHELYEFFPDKLVRRISPTDIVADLDIGDFNGYEDKIEALITRVWTLGDHRIHINWKTSSTEGVTPYQFKVVANSDGRDGTSRGSRTISFHQNSRVTAFGHEFGHVLGFSDFYYDIWKPNLCEYDFEFNEADLMSDDVRGKVTEAEWTDLLKNYPEAK